VEKIEVYSSQYHMKKLKPKPLLSLTRIDLDVKNGTILMSPFTLANLHLEQLENSQDL